MRTVTYQFAVGGNPADLDAPPTLTVTREDTGGTVVNGLAMTRVSLGFYTYSFAEPVANLVYKFSAAGTYLGIPIVGEGAIGQLTAGPGPYPLTAHFTDSSTGDDLIGASVRVSGTQTAGPVTSDADGLATLDLSAGTVRLSYSAPGYASGGGTQVVLSGGTWASTGTTTLEISMLARGVPTPPAGSDAVVYAYAHTGSGAAACGRRFYLRMIGSGTDNDIWGKDPYCSSVSDSVTGEATADVKLGASYQASVDGRAWTDTFVVDVESFHLGEIVASLKGSCWT